MKELIRAICLCAVIWLAAMAVRAGKWGNSLPVLCVRQAAEQAVEVLGGRGSAGDVIAVLAQPQSEGGEDAVTVTARSEIQMD